MPVREGNAAIAESLISHARYRVDAVIGAGGMGEVYRGTDTILQRPVAIKVLARHATGRFAPDRILAEARAASALSHANVCTIYEISEAEGQPCIVMEYLEGQPLSKLIPPDTGLPIETVVSYAVQIVEALVHAHENHIVHRDLKSANIIITAHQRAKVLDFGLAINDRVGAGEDTSTVEDGDSDSEPSTPGTLRYMAPEVLRGARADHQSDIWALGVVLYEMAAGKRPFDGRTSHEISAAILTQPPEPLPARVPAALRAVIMTCLTKDRTRRYQAASEVRVALHALQLEWQGGRTRWSIGRRFAALLGIAGLALVIVALALAARQLTRPTNTSLAVVPNTTLTYVTVLPIVDSATSAEVQALTDTLAEMLINRIDEVRLPGLKVIALPTAVQFRKRPGDPLASAREELHAVYAVTIKMTKRGERLTLSAALNDTRDRSQIWGNLYEVAAADIFDAQANFTVRIIEALSRGLGLDPQVARANSLKPGRETTQDYSALEMYALGRHFWYLPTATGDGYKKARSFYEAAIKRDPNYAAPYLGLGDAVGSMGWEGWIPPRDAYKAVAESLAQATKLDPKLGQLHYTRAGLMTMTKDWAAAEAEYKLAITAAPSSVMNRRFYAFFLAGRGRLREALAVLKDTADPEGLATNLAIATVRYWSDDLDGAIVGLTETIAIDPWDPATAAAHEILADVFESKGRLRQAITERQQALQLNGATEEAEMLGRDYAALGFDAAMRAFYQRQLQIAAAQSLETYISPVYIGILHIHLGDTNKAFTWLDKAVDEGAPWLNSVRTDPVFRPLRSDARYEAFVRRSELRPSWAPPH